MSEVRAADLAFGQDEAAELFAQLTVDGGRRAVSSGWSTAPKAGLRGFAWSPCTSAVRTTSTAAVAAFSGDDHSVAAICITEVLDRQTPELVAFLEKISVVDLVCADLADSLTGRRDGAAMLAELAASHLFVEALGRPGRWYRLHRLIADILRARPSRRRPAATCTGGLRSGSGDNDMPLEAIGSAVAGELWPLAADLAGAHTLAMVMGGRGHELERVLAEIPRTVLGVHAELAASLAGVRVSRGSDVEVAALLDGSAAAADALSRRRAARVRILRDLSAGGLTRAAGDWASTVAVFQRVPVEAGALAALGMVGAEMVPVLVNSNLGAAAYWAGDLAAAERHLAAATSVELDHRVPTKLNARPITPCSDVRRGSWTPPRRPHAPSSRPRRRPGW